MTSNQAHVSFDNQRRRLCHLHAGFFERRDLVSLHVVTSVRDDAINLYGSKFDRCGDFRRIREFLELGLRWA